MKLIPTVSPQIEAASAHEVCRWAIETFGPSFAVVTSFQAEGMVVLDMAASIDPQVRVITLDTGRLPAETYDMMEQVRERYGVSVETVAPEAGEVERMVTAHGPNLFYESAAHRTLCCHIRKVRPLERKLESVQAYAVGLRRGQSGTRGEQPKVQEANGRFKISPIAEWSKEEVEEYANRHSLPRHPLYSRGYTSIGCAPCTRATAPGEDERAGRWWWETDAAKECGLHFTPSGKAARAADVLIEEILRKNA